MVTVIKRSQMKRLFMILPLLCSCACPKPAPPPPSASPTATEVKREEPKVFRAEIDWKKIRTKRDLFRILQSLSPSDAQIVQALAENKGEKALKGVLESLGLGMFFVVGDKQSEARFEQYKDLLVIPDAVKAPEKK